MENLKKRYENLAKDFNDEITNMNEFNIYLGNLMNDIREEMTHLNNLSDRKNKKELENLFYKCIILGSY